MGELIEVEVAFAHPQKQSIVSVKVEKGASVQKAIDDSGILEQIVEIDLSKMPVGIFSKVCKLDSIVEAGDRVEIYRPLLHSPMDARRGRAEKQ